MRACIDSFHIDTNSPTCAVDVKCKKIQKFRIPATLSSMDSSHASFVAMPLVPSPEKATSSETILDASTTLCDTLLEAGGEDEAVVRSWSRGCDVPATSPSPQTMGTVQIEGNGDLSPVAERQVSAAHMALAGHEAAARGKAELEEVEEASLIVAERREALEPMKAPAGDEAVMQGRARTAEGGAVGGTDSPLRSCSCKKTKCLKLFCSCFARGAMCDIDTGCLCSGCCNSGGNEYERMLAIDAATHKNPGAFLGEPKRKFSGKRSCPGCSLLVSIATRNCACGHQFFRVKKSDDEARHLQPVRRWPENSACDLPHSSAAAALMGAPAVLILPVISSERPVKGGKIRRERHPGEIVTAHAVLLDDDSPVFLTPDALLDDAPAGSEGGWGRKPVSEAPLASHVLAHHALGGVESCAWPGSSKSALGHHVDVSEVPAGVTCKCKTSRCLKLYCACFTAEQLCTGLCACEQCFNEGTHENDRLIAVHHVTTKKRHHYNTNKDKQIGGCNASTLVGSSDRPVAGFKKKRGRTLGSKNKTPEDRLELAQQQLAAKNETGLLRSAGKMRRVSQADTAWTNELVDTAVLMINAADMMNQAATGSQAHVSALLEAAAVLDTQDEQGCTRRAPNSNSTQGAHLHALNIPPQTLASYAGSMRACGRNDVELAGDMGSVHGVGRCKKAPKIKTQSATAPGCFDDKSLQLSSIPLQSPAARSGGKGEGAMGGGGGGGRKRRGIQLGSDPKTPRAGGDSSSTAHACTPLKPPPAKDEIPRVVHTPPTSNGGSKSGGRVSSGGYWVRGTLGQRQWIKAGVARTNNTKEQTEKNKGGRSPQTAMVASHSTTTLDEGGSSGGSGKSGGVERLDMTSILSVSPTSASDVATFDVAAVATPHVAAVATCDVAAVATCDVTEVATVTNVPMRTKKVATLSASCLRDYTL